MAALQLREDDRQLIVDGDPFDATDDLERPFAVELVEYQLEDGRDALLSAHRSIAVLTNCGLYAATCFGCHVRAAVDDLGHRRHRDARLLRNEGDGCAPCPGLAAALVSVSIAGSVTMCESFDHIRVLAECGLRWRASRVDGVSRSRVDYDPESKRSGDVSQLSLPETPSISRVDSTCASRNLQEAG